MSNDGPFLADDTLAMAADVVDDLESVRVANENRFRTLTMVGEHGHGLDVDHPDVKNLAELVADLQRAEHKAVLQLQRTIRRHPLGEFVKTHKGVGEKQFARLLATIRDPYWNDLHDRPRTLRELYAFCGFSVDHGPTQPRLDSQSFHGGADGEGDTTHSASDSLAQVGGVAPSRRKGMVVNWNPDARKRVWLIASKCVLFADSPYREIYDKARVQYADAVHTSECRRCGPKGKPALPGSPLSAGHQHARAVRLIAKKGLLTDLWRAAKDLHTAQAASDSHQMPGGVEDET